MNLFISWGYDANGPAFKKIISELNVKKCYYNAGNLISNIDDGTEYQYVDIDEKLAFYQSAQEDLLPLDADLLDKMSKYETVAMDIIWRWRRSISNDHSYMNIKKVYKIYLRYWNDFLISKEIDLVILFNVPHVPTMYFIYALAKIYNIPLVMMQYLADFDNGYRNKIIMSDLSISEDVFYNNHYKVIKNKYKNSNIININDDLEVFFSEYNKENEVIKRIISSGREPIKDIISLMYSRINIYIRRNDWRILFNKAVYYFKYIPLSKYLLRKIEKYEVLPDFKKDYFFFPLHYQPEATTLPLAGRYVDQLMIIDMLSKALPDNIDLYVKEHPSFWNVSEKYEGVFESRNKEYYEHISKLKNVKLIKHSYSSLELMDKCRCVVTATGTAALEAVFKGKSVMVFSDFIYSKLPGAYKISNYNDCVSAISAVLNDKQEKNDKELRIFFKSLEEDYLKVGINQGLEDKENSSMDLYHSSMVTANKLISYIKRNYLKVNNE